MLIPCKNQTPPERIRRVAITFINNLTVYILSRKKCVRSPIKSNLLFSLKFKLYIQLMFERYSLLIYRYFIRVNHEQNLPSGHVLLIEFQTFLHGSERNSLLEGGNQIGVRQFLHLAGKSQYFQ